MIKYKINVKEIERAYECLNKHSNVTWMDSDETVLIITPPESLIRQQH